MELKYHEQFSQTVFIKHFSKEMYLEDIDLSALSAKRQLEYLLGVRGIRHFYNTGLVKNKVFQTSILVILPKELLFLKGFMVIDH